MNQASATHAISHLVIHRLAPGDGAPSRVELRPEANPLDDAAARLMERVCRALAERPGKGFGHFERDEANFPMPRWVRAHAIEGSLDFAGLSREMLGHLQQRIDEEVLGMRQILGDDLPFAGFYSYGEISPMIKGMDCKLHNQTMTITTLSER